MENRVCVVIRHVELLPRSGLGGILEIAEVLADPRLDRVRLEVADGDDRHQVGPVPVVVEAPQGLVGRVLEDLAVADRQPLGVARAVEEDGELLVAHARLGAAAESPLLDHDAALLVDLLVLEGDAVGPVLEDLEGRVDDLRVVGRDLEHVDRLVEARVGVDVRAEAHADALEVVDQLLLLEVLGAVEGHVLDEVGQPALVVVLQRSSRR